MNRNVESHFSRLPAVDIQRSVFDRSSSHKTSFNVGDLVPLYIDEILPGDTVQLETSKVVRLQTLLAPVMDNIYLDTYWFFVPNRIVWSHWQEFCGENRQSAWAPTTTYTIPKIKSPAGGFSSGTIADYFGLPVGVEWSDGKHMPSALPFRAYAKICDEFFRDQNLTDPLNIPTGDANQDGSNGDNYISDVANGGKPFKVAKYHDYFTSCLPSPQKGTSPSIPIGEGKFIGGDFPVYAKNELIDVAKFYPERDLSGSLRFLNIGNDESRTYRQIYNSVETVPGAVNTAHTPAESREAPGLSYPANLWASVPDQTTQSSASIDINQLRLAFQMQKYLERNARGGTRYIEILKSHFGVTSPDARLQRPEYLGGNRISLSVRSVNNTAQSEQDFLGDLGANSVTQDVHFDVNKSFVEHGYLICVACARYDHTYSQGLERFWFRNNFMDFYLPVFANIGEQPVYTDEIYFTNTEDVFGYNEAWADYRYKPNRVSGEMRPGVPNTLSYWHFADLYSSAPTLSDGWIREDKTNVDRTLAVSSSVANQIFADFYFNAKFARPMPMYSIPGLIDHN